MRNIRDLVNSLDTIADDVEKQDKSIALAIDFVSDQIEKTAFFNQSTWLPGRITRGDPNKSQDVSNKLRKRAVYVCLSCNLRRSAGVYICPRCGSSMQKSFY